MRRSRWSRARNGIAFAGASGISPLGLDDSPQSRHDAGEHQASSQNMKQIRSKLLVTCQAHRGPCDPARAGRRAGRSPSPPHSGRSRERVRPSVGRAKPFRQAGPPSQNTRVNPRAPSKCKASREADPSGYPHRPAEPRLRCRERQFGLDRRRGVRDHPGRNARAVVTTCAGAGSRRWSRSRSEPASDPQDPGRPHVQLRIVGENRSDADHDGIRMRPHEVDPRIRGLAGNHQSGSPCRVPANPSRRPRELDGDLGRPVVTRMRWPRWSRLASFCETADRDAMPASRRRAWPWPCTRGSGSSSAETSRVMPAFRIGVDARRRLCRDGSRVRAIHRASRPARGSPAAVEGDALRMGPAARLGIAPARRSPAPPALIDHHARRPTGSARSGRDGVRQAPGRAA